MIFYLAVIFLFGLAVGSFINVCAWRIPRDESVVYPPSHCTSCTAHLHWYENLPLLSYLFLHGRCGHCGQPISFRYPAVELATGICFAATAWRMPPDWAVAGWLYFTFVLIVITAIDISHFIIPDVFTYSLLAAGLLLSAANPFLGEAALQRVLQSFLGAAAGGGILLLAGWAGEKAFKKEAMGGGDVKLLAGIGAFVGMEKVFAVLFTASLLGAAAGIVMIKMRRMGRRDYIPFGPFIAAAAYINLFLPPPLFLIDQIALFLSR